MSSAGGSQFDDESLEAYFAEMEARTAEKSAPRKRREPAVVYVEPVCPTPEKIAYPTLAAVTGAILAITSTRRAAPVLRSYECSCGSWHLTRSGRS